MPMRVFCLRWLMPPVPTHSLSRLAPPGDLRRARAALWAVRDGQTALAPTLRAAGVQQMCFRHVQVLALPGDELTQGSVMRVGGRWHIMRRQFVRVVRAACAGEFPLLALRVYTSLARLVANAAADHRRAAQHLVHHVFLLGRQGVDCALASVQAPELLNVRQELRVQLRAGRCGLLHSVQVLVEEGREVQVCLLYTSPSPRDRG